MKISYLRGKTNDNMISVDNLTVEFGGTGNLAGESTTVEVTLNPAELTPVISGTATKTYDGRWHLTPNGFLVSNAIISDLLLIQEKN